VKHPIFHPDEEARVGRTAYDKRLIGAVCKIEAIKAPIYGEWRYLVTTPSGLASIVLESTLVKQFEAGDISHIWRQREAR
jgi:hypothetical protein